MRKLAFLLILISSLFLFCLYPAVYGSEPATGLVQVGLVSEQKEIILNLADIAGILDLSFSEPQTVPVPGEQAIISATADLLAINFMPVSSGPLLIIPGQRNLTLNTRSYRGVFMIVAKNSKLTIINRLSIEDYLRGVVPREVMADWPMAVLKAQTIAARTYTMASLNRHGSAGFDLCPTDHCQVYGGADAEKPSTDLAIASTEGKVIIYRGKIISALYHSSSGGSTIDSADVWNTAVPYLKPVIDWDQNSPHAQWTKSLNWEELQGSSARSYPKIGRLNQLQGVTFGKDGNLLKVNLRGDLGEVAITGEQFRSLTGLPSTKAQIGIIYGPLPSITLWWIRNTAYPEAIVANNEIPGLTADILNPPWDLPDPWSWLQDKEPQKIVFKGFGWGHGVGLSQWGAKGMADNGYNEQQILEHFYPGIMITEIKSIIGDRSKK